MIRQKVAAQQRLRSWERGSRMLPAQWNAPPEDASAFVYQNASVKRESRTHNSDLRASALA
jgi:hypothetical protein